MKTYSAQTKIKFTTIIISVFLFNLFFLFSENGFSQAPDWTWATGIGNWYNDGANSITSDDSANIFVAGYYSTNFFYPEAYIAKFDFNNGSGWSLIGKGADNASSVAADAQGNCLVTGNFGSSVIFGNDTLTHTGGLFIVKFDGAGNPLWAKGPDNGTASTVSVTTDPQGNIYVAGNFSGDSLTIDSVTLTQVGSVGTQDLFLVKYAANGNLLSVKGAGGNNTDFVTSVKADISGNIYMTGSFGSPSITFDTITLNKIGTNADIFLVKYDTNGNVLWAKSEGGNTNVMPNSITTDTLGNMFVAGYFSNSAIVFGSTTLSNPGPFIVKYDSNGNVLWAKCADNGNGIAKSVAVDNYGNSYMSGDFGPSITFGSVTLTNQGPFIVKYDSSGNVMWAKSADGGNGNVNSATVDTYGNIYISGTFTPTITFGPTVLTAQVYGGSHDMFIARLDNVTLVPEQQISSDDIHLFPNPFHDKTILSIPVSLHNTLLIIYDITGRVAQHYPIINQHTIIARGNLSSGIYIYKVQNENEVIGTGKLIVQ